MEGKLSSNLSRCLNAIRYLAPRAVSARRSKLTRPATALRELAHHPAQTAPVSASVRFVGKGLEIGSVEGSLRETPARVTREQVSAEAASRNERLCAPRKQH